MEIEMKKSFAIIATLFFSVSAPAKYADECNKNPEETRAMLQDLKVEALCASEFNPNKCGELVGSGPTQAAAIAGLTAAAIGDANPIPGPDLSTSDPSRAERDQKFRNYVKDLDPNHAKHVSYEQLIEKAKSDGKTVVILGGYSGQGYENPDELKKYIREVLNQAGDNTMFVIGGTEGGIGDAYKWIPEIAQEMDKKNVETAGIVSRNAAEYGVAKQDYIVFVDTDVNDWEVKKDGRSLMVDIAAQTQGQMIYFRGGPISQAEINEALARNVQVSLIRDPALGPSIATATKKLRKANPNLDPESEEFKKNLAEVLEAADKPTAGFANNGTLRISSSKDKMAGELVQSFGQIYNQRNLVDSLPRKGLGDLLGNKALRLGAGAVGGALTGGILTATDAIGYIADSTPAGACGDTLAGAYFNWNPDDCTRPLMEFNSKLKSFLQMDFESQLKELKTADLCFYLQKMHKSLRTPNLSGVKCDSEGFTSSGNFSVRTEKGKIIEISGVPPNSNLNSEIESIHYNTDGSIKSVCPLSIRGVKCEAKFDVLKFSGTEAQLNAQTGMEDDLIRSMNAYRLENIEIGEALACCSSGNQNPSSARCGLYGISPASSNQNQNGSGVISE
jgi:hypothetical protein